MKSRTGSDSDSDSDSPSDSSSTDPNRTFKSDTDSLKTSVLTESEKSKVVGDNTFENIVEYDSSRT